MAKNSNQNIQAFCQRKRTDVAWVCTHRANECGVTAVTVSCVFASKFTVTNDALETQCLYDGTMKELQS